MAKLTPAEAAAKLISRAKAAAPSIAAQVDKVQESPTAAAARAIPKMVQNFQEAAANGKVARGLARVSKEDWQKAMKEKGVPRIAAGLDQSATKIQQFYTEFLPFVDQVQAKVRAMASTTLEDNIARMTTNARELSKFKRGG